MFSTGGRAQKLQRGCSAQPENQRVVSQMGFFELLCGGETFCVLGHRITSHLCQNPDDDGNGSTEKYLLCNSYAATLLQFFKIIVIIFYFKERVTLNLANFHSLNK